MNDVRQSDIDMVVSTLKVFFKVSMQQKSFNFAEFLKIMESTFKAAGYRDPQGGGYGQRNILIIQDSAVGDFILASGAVREIRRLYPDAYIEMVIYPRSQNMAEACPYVDKVVSKERNYPNWNNPEFFYMHDVEFAKNLLKRRFDVCYSFGHYVDSTFLMYMSGAKTRITFDYSNSPREIFNCLVTHPVKIPPRHYAETRMAIIDDVLHSPVSNREIEVWLTGNDLKVAKSLINSLSRPIYALCMGATDPKRHYPVEKYSELVKMILSEEPTATFINLGGGQDDAFSSQILQQRLGKEIFNRHVVNLVNKTNFRIDAAIMSFCDIYIGNNTGNMEMASAVKCPCLVMECFPKDLDSGISDVPRVYAPYKVPCVSVQPKHALPECAVNEPYYSYGCRADRPHCITQIEPETIFKGFHLLKERIAKNLIEPLYIS